MRFHVNPGDELPIYRQIMRQVVDALAAGQLRAGDQMPSHRELAGQLVIAPLTVKKAYDELERAGYLTLARGHGTFVAEGVSSLAEEGKLERLRPVAQRLARDGQLLGVQLRQLQSMLSEEWRSLRKLRARNIEEDEDHE